MRIRILPLLASLLTTCAIATPSVAGVTPYVRLDFGGSQLQMAGMNDLIRGQQAVLNEQGAPVVFQGVGSAYGPGASVGCWILPGLRLGATYSFQRAARTNWLDVPAAQFSYTDDLIFRMTEIGGEAAVRIKRLGGLTMGVNVAQGRTKMSEGLTVQSVHGPYRSDGTALRTRPTYGAFIGFDQTNPAGIAGFIHLGFRHGDMGDVPNTVTDSDGAQSSGQTIPLDYSGFYLKVGIGYDFVR